jgi:acyl-coenzyme A synthetase/AMP-(fatty) acid ligase
MKPTPVAALFLSDDRGEVAFDRDRGVRTWSELIGQVGGIANALRAQAGSHWVIAEDDAFDFAAALFGCWAAEKVPVLVPNARLLSKQLLAREMANEIAGVIGAASDGSLPRLEISASEPFAGQLDPEAELVLFTSGSTGEPKRAPKSLRHLQAELEVLEALWGERLAGRAVYATVSQQHMYGLLFRMLWPLAAGRPFASYTLEFPEDLVSGPAHDGVLISSPALLKRLGELPEAAAGRWSEVFSSGGLIEAAVAEDVRRALRVAPIEVLGSTETGGVAWRRQDLSADAALWKPLPEVRVRTDDEGFLSVSSPFIGHSGWFRMGDKVQVVEGRPFHLLGRGDRVAKIEDKRVSLAEIEAALIAHEYIDDAACVALDRGGRQSVGALILLSSSGESVLGTEGRRGLGEILRKVLREQIEPVAIPRTLRYVNCIPTDAQGKRVVADITSALVGSDAAP